MVRFSLSVLMVAVTVPCFAQTGRAKAPPANAVPGYKAHTIEGFTLLINQDVHDADTSKFERKPLDVLELELKMITKLMNQKSVDVLRRLLLWVEWKEQEEIGSGRPGTPVAVYYGGHQQTMLRDGKHPLKAKTVTILRMDLLTREHQPKDDSGRCVLLHEMAHAVHDQLLGRTNSAVAGAFQQAMERKLYDKGLYASTNDAEFFAELSCAYFDQLHYFPRNRRELRDHDLQTFKLMESVWGRSASTKTNSLSKKSSLLANDGSDKHDLKLKVSDVRFGAVTHGAKFSADDAAGQVLVIGSWGDSDPAVLGKLVDLNDELGPYGVRTIIVANEGYGAEPERTRREVGANPKSITVMERLGVPDEDRLIIPRPPHTIVFDPDGTCIFRGNGFDAIPHVRAAVGRKLVDEFVKTEEPGKTLVPGITTLTSGEPLFAALVKLSPSAVGSSDPDAASAAKELYAAVLAPGETKLNDARELAKSDPLAAYIAAEKLYNAYKGTTIGTNAARVANTLRSNRAVVSELTARKYLEQVRKLDGYLSSQRGGFDPTDPAFQARNGPTLLQLVGVLGEMKKKFPTAPATSEAGRIAGEYGIR